MTMSLAGRAGIFLPDEIAAMRRELEAGRMPGETPAQRNARAVMIVARHNAGKAAPPLGGGAIEREVQAALRPAGRTIPAASSSPPGFSASASRRWVSNGPGMASAPVFSAEKPNRP